mgnify:CR=1 FL=1
MKYLYFVSPFLLQLLIWIPTRVFLRLFCSLEIRGLHNLRSLNQAIFASNHTSELDPILVPASLPLFSRFSPMFYTAAEDKNFKGSLRFGWRRYIYGGLFFKAWGAYPVAEGKKNYALALQPHLQILRDGGSICIFPEGFLSKDGTLQQGKGGAVFLAGQTEVELVPVKITGVFKASFREIISRKRVVTVSFGKPLWRTDLHLHEEVVKNPSEHLEAYKEATRILMEAIQNT